jgi:hypothetical protein
MSKMGQVILEIQELAHQGVPDTDIAKYTDTSIGFVQDVVKDYFSEEYYESEPYDARDQ